MSKKRKSKWKKKQAIHKIILVERMGAKSRSAYYEVVIVYKNGAQSETHFGSQHFAEKFVSFVKRNGS